MGEPGDKPEEESKYGGFKESSLVLPPDSEKDWPLNFKELLTWQHDKVLAASKEAELRIKQATQIVADCADGKTTLQEAGEQTFEYTRRWGESLHGVFEAHRKTDDQILEEMAAHRSGKWLDYVKEKQKGERKGQEGPSS